MKTLIAYCSGTGKTKAAAERIRQVCGGDIIEIKGKKKYGAYPTRSLIGVKEILTKEFPPLSMQINDFDSYDRVLIGFPIWCGTCPRVVATFLNQYDFKTKEVYPFCTSDGTPADTAYECASQLCQNGTVHKAIRIDGQSDAEIEAWLNG